MSLKTNVLLGPGGLDKVNNVISSVIVDVPDSNLDILQTRALAAMSDNRAFLALVPPLTNAQVVAQVNALTRQNNGIMRLLLSLFDGTD